MGYAGHDTGAGGTDAMRALLLMVGVPDMAIEQMLIVAALAIACAFAFAWIADALLDENGFGVFLNTIILLVGAVLGILLWRKLGYFVRLNPHALSASIATGSGILLLVTCAMMRRWI